jgi:hypothetical protein
MPTGTHVPFKPSNKHYIVGFERVPDVALFTAASGNDADLIHEALGHFSHARIEEALRNDISNIHFRDSFTIIANVRLACSMLSADPDLECLP